MYSPNERSAAAARCMRPTFVDSLIQIVARSVFFSTATPHPEKITPTPEGMGANARRAAGVMGAGCRAGGRKLGKHSGGFAEVVSKCFNVLDSWASRLFACDLLNRSLGYARSGSNSGPFALGLLKLLHNEFVQ